MSENTIEVIVKSCLFFIGAMGIDELAAWIGPMSSPGRLVAEAGVILVFRGVFPPGLAVAMLCLGMVSYILKGWL